jgi:hypothetical protein
VFHFFGEDVCNVKFSVDMTNCNKLIRNVFTDPILLHLNVTKSFGGHFLRPLNAGTIIIVDHIGGWYEEITNLEKIQYLNQFKQKFDAFISGVYFRFSGAGCSNFLSFRCPMYRTQKVNVESRHGA